MSAEQLDLADAGERFLDRAGEFAGGLLHLPVRAAQLAAGDADQPGHHRRDGDDHQRQLPRRIDQVAGQADDHHGVADDDDPGIGQCRADLRDVVQDARQHAPARFAEVRRQRQVHLVAKHLLAQIGDRLVRDPLARHAGTVLGQPLDQEGQQQEQGDLPTGGLVLVDQALVDQGLEQGRQHRFERRGDDHRQHRKHHHPSIRANRTQQPPVERQRGLHSRCSTLSTTRLAQPSS